MDLLTKGKIGELIIYKELLDRNFNVYTSIVDNNGIDAIIYKDNKYFTLQIKHATKTSFVKINKKYTNNRRYSFGFGTTGLRTDYTICCTPEGNYIIPKKWIPIGDAFCIFPDSEKSKFSKFKNRWDLIGKNDNDILHELNLI